MEPQAVGLEAFAPPEPPIPVPFTYHVIVRPKPPKNMTTGGIALAKRTQNAERAVRTIGQVVAIGALAWKARTDGLNFAECPAAQDIGVGDWVCYKQHSGQKLRLRDQDASAGIDDAGDDYLLIMADTDVLAKLSPGQQDQFFDWV